MRTLSSQLILRNLTVSILDKEILHGVSLIVNPGEVHVLMGPNGSGKSTLASALLGHPSYVISDTSEIRIGRKDLVHFLPEDRAKAGLFLAFQSPISIPGISIMHLLRSAYQEIHSDATKKNGASSRSMSGLRRTYVGPISMEQFTKRVKDAAALVRLDESFLRRSIHEGFSGGERKKVEMLQAIVLEPKFAIFDEIDTGLDVDALGTVSRAIETLRKKKVGIIIITHYQRMLKYVTPDVVHVLVRGNIVKTGSAKLARSIENEGYKKYEKTFVG